AEVADPAKLFTAGGGGAVASCGLEQRQRLAGEPLYRVGRAPADVHARQRGFGACEGFAGLVSRCRRALRGNVGDSDRSCGIGPVEGARELDLQADLEPVRTREGERPPEQRNRGARVAAPETTATRA